MPKFTPDDPTTRVSPQAKPAAPTVRTLDEIPQPDLYVPQRSFTTPYGDTRRNFPPPVNAVESWPSSATTDEARALTQPTEPSVTPIKPRRMK